MLRSAPLLILVVLASMSAARAADIGVSPARLSLTAPSGGTTSSQVTLFNTGSAPVALTVNVGDWVQSIDGKLSFLPAGSSQYSASAWVSPSASSLTVPPNGNATVRLSVHVPRDPKLEGTYQTVVYFETAAKPANGAGAQLMMRQRLGLITYVTIAGTATKGSSLSDMYLAGKTLDVVVSNTGNTLMRASGSVQLRDAGGKTVATIKVSDDAVMRESQRRLALALPKGLAPGYYVALALIDDSRGGSLVGQLPIQLGRN